MEDVYDIEIEYKGKSHTFKAALSTVGYLHKFYVLVNGIEVTYEPDEERNYRAIVNDTFLNKINDNDKQLIKAIADKLEALLKNS